MGNKKQQFTIEELHQLVWKESISRLAKRLDFNENVIRQKCKELGIPTPTSAYWSGLKFGKSVEITALPKSVDPNQVLVLEDKLKKKRRSDKPSEQSNRAKDISNEGKKEVVQPAQSDKKQREHPLVVQTRNEFKRQSRIAPHDWEELRKSIPHLSISVTKEQRERAYAIFDSIIKGLNRQGYQVTTNEHGNTKAIIMDIEIPIRIREKTKRVVKANQSGRWPEYEYPYTGILVFVSELRPWRRKEYYDKPFVKLEEKVDVIVERMIAEGLKEHQEKIEREVRRKQEAEQKQLEKERRLRVNAELVKFKDLFRMQKRWHQAETMRAFLDTYEEVLGASNDFSDEQQNWLDWARKKTEWFDPFIEDDDELMEGIDRDKLEPLPVKDGWY